VKDSSLSNIQKFLNNDSQTDYYVHSGTIKNFVEGKYLTFMIFYNHMNSFLAHFLSFLNQCHIEKYGKPSDSDLLASVTSYFE
jgi:hypothetical protein